ncbi:UDP-N-acetylmuramoylalanyl-D-glutamate--2,6-diaminopimelate ligase [Rhodococcus sp. OK611]|uniref:Mur ligase family protein n=1 Tax=Rhodococcus sp. OK611 TaxID=2135731 RepID=UPI000D4BEBD8|nr:UDP-N-acetylmuramoylalanyl-D-glutamate--2,6-diaminopimelate ligase [Rhodococcus sp. OK611]
MQGTNTPQHSTGEVAGPAGSVPGDLRPEHPPQTPVTALAELIGARVQWVAGTAATAATAESAGDAPISVTGVELRAQSIEPGDLFAALPGARAHGAEFAASALERGAVAVLTDPAGMATLAALAPATALPVLVHPDPRSVLGEVSATVYGRPADRLQVIGITGTSGKTTTAYLVEAGLTASGRRAGLVGTIETRIEGRRVPSALTTPEAPQLHALFAVMLERGLDTVVMEVSSHALSLGRVDGTDFAIGAFTNLSQDHLDFHDGLDDYFAAKSRLFARDSTVRARRAVVCVDDEWGSRMAEIAAAAVPPESTAAVLPESAAAVLPESAAAVLPESAAAVLPESAAAVPPESAAEAPPTTVSITTGGADWTASEVVAAEDGSQRFIAHGPTGSLPVALRLPGHYNVANALLALATLAAAGVDPERAAAGIGSVDVPGRVQRVDRGQDFLAVVDYAHKPAALEAVIATLRGQSAGRLAVVVGAGGDRDQGKRPMMGEVSARGADLVIITDDNPRSEDPAAIRAAVREGALGVPEAARAEVREFADRAEAIADAVRWAEPGDMVLVAGKGHEIGQEINGVKHPFDDREVLAAAIDAVGRSDEGQVR